MRTVAQLERILAYPGYQRDLKEIYKSEVTGEALFSTAAALSLSLDKKRKWQQLARLETQTRERYLSYVRSTDEEARYPVVAKISGYLFGVVFALMPWRAAMEMLSAGTPPLIEVFCRLARNANENDQPFFQYVVQHELAIADFARRELVGADDSMKRITGLLEEL